jgi:hypothetical protein
MGVRQGAPVITWRTNGAIVVVLSIHFGGATCNLHSYSPHMHDHTMTNRQIWGSVSRITRHSGIIISGINAF